MQILEVKFGQLGGSPSLSTSGIVLRVSRGPQPPGGPSPLVVHGHCRLEKRELPADKLDLLRGLFLIVVSAPDQRTVAANLAGGRLLFDDDVMDAGDAWVADFRCVLDATGRTRPVYLHAACHQYVSNVIRIEFP
jgi:hypothetical protein